MKIKRSAFEIDRDGSIGKGGHRYVDIVLHF